MSAALDGVALNAQRDASLDRVLDQVRAATASGTLLCIRGGNSKAFYGGPLVGAELSTRELRGISSYEPTELVLTARSGTPLTEVEAALAERGQCLPFEPPHFGGSATVGGCVASGLSGPARAAVGSVRDYVLGASLINGRAEVMSFGGQVIKNVAGYDVSRLLAGSLGVLGVIAEVTLKVLPVAPAEATLRFEVSEAEALHRLNAWGGQPLPLNASSWFLDQGTPTLYLRLRGAVAAVEAAGTKLLAEFPGERVDSPATRADWAAARDLGLPWFTQGFARGQDLWRLSVPQTAAPLGVGDTMIDWLGGQRWVWADAGDTQAAARLRNAAAQAGGHATLFKPAAGSGAAQAFSPLDPVTARIHQALKKEFDPAGIFNRGRLCPNF